MNKTITFLTQSFYFLWTTILFFMNKGFFYDPSFFYEQSLFYEQSFALKKQSLSFLLVEGSRGAVSSVSWVQWNLFQYKVNTQMYHEK